MPGLPGIARVAAASLHATRGGGPQAGCGMDPFADIPGGGGVVLPVAAVGAAAVAGLILLVLLLCFLMA